MMTASGMLQPESQSPVAASTSGDGDPKRGLKDEDPTLLLYKSSHFRRVALASLLLALASDIAVFVIGCTIMSSLSYSVIKQELPYLTGPEYSWNYANGTEAAFHTRQFFNYLFVPSVVAANTIWELDLVFRRRKLSARRIVVTASLSIFLWCIILALSLVCDTGSFFAPTAVRNMCPMDFYIGWVVKPEIPWPARAYALDFYMLFLPPVAILFYIPYLVYGSVIYHRERTSRHHGSKALEIQDDHVDGALHLDGDSALELETRSSSFVTFDHTARHYVSSQSSSVVISSSEGTGRWSNGISIGETLPEEGGGSSSASVGTIAPSYRERPRSSEMVVQ